MGLPEDKKRAHIRFTDDNLVAWLSVHNNKDEFEAEHIGLVVNESYTGCGVIFVKSQVEGKFKLGSTYTIAVGNLDPIEADLKWIKELDNDTVRMGFEFILKK